MRRMAPSRRQIAAQQASPPTPPGTKTFAAPISGLVTADNLIASRPNSAQRLDNIFPMTQSVRARAGSTLWVNLIDPVVSMLTYDYVADPKLFVATADALYDATTGDVTTLLDENGAALTDEFDDPLDASNPVPSLAGQSGGYYSYVNFATSGGYFLIVVNGDDHMQQYDGTDWATITGVSSPVSITGVDTSTLSHISVYRYRIFMVEKDSLKVWYLPVNSIGGAASSITLAGIFSGGGSISFTATWSMDAGDGLDDKFVVVSTTGEVAVFQGSNPSDATDWSLVGRYQLTRPLGPRCFMRAGGELMLGTEEGLVPISQAVSKEAGQLSMGAVSAPIEPTWATEAADRQTYNWEIVKWPSKNMALVTLPTSSVDAADQYCFVVNLETGAWARYTGWDTRCAILFDDQVYFGTRDGDVIKAESGGSDDGTAYTPTCVYNWDAMDSLGYFKTVTQARATFITDITIDPALSASTDYDVSLPSAPSTPANTASGRAAFTTRWVSVGRSGYSIAPQWQIECSGNTAPTTEFLEMTVRYTMGELVV